MLAAAYARREITWTAILGGLATVAAWYAAPAWALLPALATVGLLAFYRDPRRRPPDDPRVILAPADGQVVEIARAAESTTGGGPVLRIMIFLSVFDVHVNRSPCAGRVVEVSYRRGEFRNALSAEAGVRNECNTLKLLPQAPLTGPVQVRQIAGVLARRIVCNARVGDELAAGQRFGMIKLGSRTEVSLPESPAWELLVAVGDKVQAGLTVLARQVAERSPETKP